MQPEDWEQVRQLLVIQADPNEAGAALVPALQRLQTRLPQAQVVVLTGAALPPSPFAPPVGTVQKPLFEALWQVPGSWLAGSVQLLPQLQAQAFDAAIILTAVGRSPYPLAYLCYLAGIRWRLGQSQEFGGGVLSHWVKSDPQLLDPVTDPVTDPATRHLELLTAAGLTEPSLRVAAASSKGEGL